ncbi:DSBA-like thioredoxin domain-containing protein [Geobacter argillaceus]|uniref:DSBA-like thioredoxin domain-containing protein n=1 Tax=Geobacter argillaceus TaxID=345631 RepID=A0A562VFC0_9BACT|nr:DSBA-like thioredoxin domain-containing protein [Geobacter argillaceus]
MELAELFAGREAMIKEMQARLHRLAEIEGVPLAERSRTCNSRRAQELGKWAEAMGKGDAFRKAVYGAYFVGGRNIAKVDELVRIVETIGLPGDKALAALAEGSFASAVDADWQRARELGVDAVPTHLCAGKRLVGFAPYEDFERLIERDNKTPVSR